MSARAAAYLVIAGVAACGCRDSSSTPPAGTAAASSPVPSASAPPEPAAGSDAGAGGARTRGDVRGRFATDKTKYALGEPMLVELEVTNSAASATITFDDRNGRYVWVVRDDSKAVVCDVGGTRGRFGSGHVASIRLAPGETHRDTSLLNGVCDAFTRPGRYHVSVMRVLSNADQMAPDRRCEDLVPPRQDDAGPREQPCETELAAFPAIAADLVVELAPWDAAALRARVATLDAERTAARRGGELSREGALTAYGSWFCDHVRCDCAPMWERYGEWFAKALSQVPSRMGGCRR